MAGTSNKVVLIAFLMNLGIAIAKFIGYFLSGSAAMLAEAVHSVADTTNQVFLFLGLRKSKRAPDKKHPFGYGMEQYIVSFIVAFMIFALGGIYSFYEGIHKLLHAEGELENLEINLAILALGIVLEGYSSFIATKEVKKVKGDLTIFQFIRKSKDQVLVTVLFEDYAALIGLGIAMAGNVIYMVTGALIVDAITTLLIGTLLAAIAGFLFIEAKSLLLGEAASSEDLEKIEKSFYDNLNVESVKELLTMHISPSQILINAHIKFKAGLTLEEVEDIIDEIEERIICEVPEVYKIFIETHQNENVSNLQTDPIEGAENCECEEDMKPNKNRKKTSIRKAKPNGKKEK